jgi:hypothetical protein
VSYATGRAAIIQPEIDCNCGATPCVQRFFLTPQFVRIPPFTRGIRCLSPCQGSDFCRRECALRVCAWGCASRTRIPRPARLTLLGSSTERCGNSGFSGAELARGDAKEIPLMRRLVLRALHGRLRHTHIHSNTTTKFRSILERYGQEGDRLPKVDGEFYHLDLWRRRATAPDFLGSFRLENYMNPEKFQTRNPSHQLRCLVRLPRL